jgi:A/G-specific adenine glycosylase
MRWMSVNTVRKLGDWYRRNARDLPWRRDRDPYRIWLSEIMLQQTQVKTVIPYFEAFLDKFPAVEDLADAPVDEVLRLWAGLGYYSRARNLHAGARSLAGRLRAGKGYPGSRKDWLEIPGVGPYTAGAVCSIALGLREPIVDGNVVRVMSRFYAIENSDPRHAEIWKHARKWVEVLEVEPETINQGLMELGALICTPRNPRCEECPIRRNCRGKTDPSRYPVKKKKAEVLKVAEEVWILYRRDGRKCEVVLKQNSSGPWRRGLWDFPPSGSVALGRDNALLAEWSSSYAVTRHRINRQHRAYRVSRLSLKSGYEWFSLNELPAVPAPTRRALIRLRQEIDQRPGPV